MTSWGGTAPEAPARSAYESTNGPAGRNPARRGAIRLGWALFLIAALALGNFLGTSVGGDDRAGGRTHHTGAGPIVTVADWCWSRLSG
jgi:hypothetical protein